MRRRLCIREFGTHTSHTHSSISVTGTRSLSSASHPAVSTTLSPLTGPKSLAMHGKMHRLIESHLLHLRASGNTKTLLSDKRDIGRFVARIIRDPRTLNRSVIAWSDEISQNEILSLIEAKTGETPSVSTVSASRLEAAVSTAERTIKEDPENRLARVKMSSGQYDRSKWIRADGKSAGEC
ncbi:hypothetical protein PMIN06_001352 [Paraphaeosphaeria minitans]